MYRLLGIVVTSMMLISGTSLAALPGTQLESVIKMPPPSDEFRKQLFEGYIRLSREEYDEGDYKDSDFFALRAKGAANNEKMEPQSVSARDLPVESLQEVAAGRRKLIVALYFGASKKMPVNMAEAQLSFDCWMQELEENRQPDDITACRIKFQAAIDLVMAIVKPSKENVSPADVQTDRFTFEVFFDFDKAQLTENARAEVVEIAIMAKTIDNRLVAVVGGADKIGDENYNVKLAQRRAETVAHELASNGVKADAVVSHGEQVRKYIPAHQGADIRNRRVLIIITEKK